MIVRTQEKCELWAVRQGKLAQLAAVGKRHHWLAVFSSNGEREVWPPTRKGPTPPRERRYLQGRFPLLDGIVDTFLLVRPDGGRIFISYDGAYYCPEGCCDKIMFIQFMVVGS